MARVLPFRQARRVDLVRSISTRMLALGPDAAERHLLRQIDVQRATLLRKGVSAEMVEVECVALTGAVRADLWRLTFTGGGAA